MPVTDAEAYRFVGERYGRRAANVRLLGAGEWSRAYAFVLDDRESVVRFGDYVEDFQKDRVMAAHSRAALPIPAVVEIGAAGDVTSTSPPNWNGTGTSAADRRQACITACRPAWCISAWTAWPTTPTAVAGMTLRASPVR